MKWIDNINNILSGKKAGNCPFCNSKNTDYRIVQISGELGTADIWCNQCKQATHLSRIKVKNEIIKSTTLPKSLKF